MHRQARDFAEAGRDLASALRLAPDSIDALFERGLLRRDQANFKAAREDFLAVVLAEEEGPFAPLAQAELEALDLAIPD